MAARTNKVEVEIVATDKASPKIDALEAKIEGLEADEARIVVTSNIERTTAQLDAAQKKLDKLDGDEATVQARLVGNLTEDLEQAQKLFEQLDGETGTVRMQLDDQTMRDGTRRASEGVNEITDSARGANSALANMVGNSAQDLGALGGIAGSSGVAIGQMAEYMSDARLAGESLGSALRAMTAVAGPIAAMAVALAAVNDIMSAMREGQAALKAFDADQIEQFNEALKQGEDLVANYNETLTETGQVLADVGEKAGPAWTNIIPGVNEITDALGGLGRFGENLENILPLLNQAGISSDIWTQVITSDKPRQAMDKLRAALDKTNISDKDRSKILIAAKAAQTNYADAVTNSAEVNKFFVETLEDVADATLKNAHEADQYVESLVQWHDETQRVISAEEAHFDSLERLNNEAESHDRITPLQREADAARAATTQYEDLFTKLNEQAARLQLQEAFAKAKEQLADTKTTALEAQGIISDLKLDVARFAEEFKVPFGLTVDVLAKIDTGQMTDAEKTVLGYIPPKPVVVPLVPRWADAALAGGATADQLERLSANTTPAQRAGTAGNVTIINPPGTPAATVDNLNTFLARNGAR